MVGCQSQKSIHLNWCLQLCPRVVWYAFPRGRGSILVSASIVAWPGCETGISKSFACVANIALEFSESRVQMKESPGIVSFAVWTVLPALSKLSTIHCSACFLSRAPMKDRSLTIPKGSFPGMTGKGLHPKLFASLARRHSDQSRDTV